MEELKKQLEQLRLELIYSRKQKLLCERNLILLYKERVHYQLKTMSFQNDPGFPRLGLEVSNSMFQFQPSVPFGQKPFGQNWDTTEKKKETWNTSLGDDWITPVPQKASPLECECASLASKLANVQSTLDSAHKALVTCQNVVVRQTRLIQEDDLKIRSLTGELRGSKAQYLEESKKLSDLIEKLRAENLRLRIQNVCQDGTSILTDRSA